MAKQGTAGDAAAGNLLYYGDNLDILRRHVDDESVDLIYLDPPFNSNADYNVLFAAQRREGARADQGVRGHVGVGLEAAQEYAEVLRSGHDRIAKALKGITTSSDPAT
jgi:site-specific DNA-methyltransferase (adenine-specific)